ncbi:MAG: 50S ribosomal protein L23 [Balneolaceae bacterium]|jgi:large subunit ribosomal protein L23|nr:50S ribosomal protein L23 [Balneolaceae bacterium]MDR9447299.1 50S ribosomal protein L23 [Balneolaceae bacterium]
MSVLIHPLVTEKTTRLAQEGQKVVFKVTKDATKPQIREAIESTYTGVKVGKVNTMIMPSKPKGRFTRSGYVAGRTSPYKKAVVTLSEGEINIFEEI